MPDLITRPEEVVELLADILEKNKGKLGIEYVGKYDERLLPSYPAVVVSSGTVDKEVHATHTFNVELRAILWVYHADMTITHSQRSKADLEMATKMVALIEDDKTFGEQVIFSYIESESPGTIAPRATKGQLVVGTKLNWYALSQSRWV